MLKFKIEMGRKKDSIKPSTDSTLSSTMLISPRTPVTLQTDLPKPPNHSNRTKSVFALKKFSSCIGFLIQFTMWLHTLSSTEGLSSYSTGQQIWCCLKPALLLLTTFSNPILDFPFLEGYLASLC